MATEPITVDKPADVPASLSASLSVDGSKNGVSEPPTVNGASAPTDAENKLVTGVEERAASADPSISGTSDSESRADGAKDKDGDKGHLRASSSAKKPTSFKSVSVNKKFLASKTGSGGASPTPSDRSITGSTKTPPPGSGSLTAPRPRLVAKTGSGAGNSLPRAGANGGKAAAAPDASAVWNRNRAPSPKKYTDEELKKYGIHMASRLKEDDTSGKNQWADIDDDDDDWAPETMTWSDGTKTSLPHPDEQPAPQAAPAPAPPVASSAPIEAPSPKPDAKPTPAAPMTLADITPSKSTNLASGKGLVLKAGAQEKQQPTLVAKPPPPPAAVKSPWATLPPVKRASPVAPESQPFQRGPSTHYRDMAPLPPKEIAADDFSRSPYRDGPSQQLFNSQSGLYEPVRERRGSLRHDGQGRHPNLLQRHPAGDHPAEPSSAFQTHRSAQDHSFGRRRASSNLSGEGREYMPRMARPSEGHMPPPESLTARRPSQAASHASPVSPAVQPAAVYGQQRGPQAYQQGPPPAGPHTDPPPQLAEQTEPQGPAHSFQDDVEMQKKLMREAREQAKKRRMEQEAREEAERKERIRKKLESLGPAPEKKSDKKEQAPKPEITRPAQIAQRDQKDPTEEVVKAIHELHQHHPEQDMPTPEPSGPRSRRLSSNNAGPPPPSQRRPSHGQETKRPESWIGSGPRPEKYTPWAGGPQPGASAVWGATRGLGNGTFGTELGRITDGPGSQTGHGPAPIGPPGAPARAPPGPIGSRSGGYANRPVGGGSELASKWVSQVEENDKKTSAEKLAERSRREASLAERGLNFEDAQPKIKDTWRPTQVTDGARRVGGSGSLDATPAPPPANPAGVIGSSILPSSTQSTPSQGRQSRFFPAMESPEHYVYGRSTSPSPPPPTMEGHPAYEGDAMHPHVLLPRSRPVVKLPPSQQAMMAERQAPRSFSWANPPQFGARPLSHAAVAAMPPPIGTPLPVQSQAQWQSKFNTLFHPGAKGSPPKSLGIDPASRNALDHTLYQNSATVSFPGKPAIAISTAGGPIMTKPMAEECFEEQEMGSLPQIRIPRTVSEATWPPAPEQTKPLPKKFSVHATAREAYKFFPINAEPGHNRIEIRLPGSTDVRAVSIASSVLRGGRGGNGRGGSRQRGPGHPNRGGAREASGSSPRAEGEASVEKEAPTDKANRRSRGGYRGRGFNSRSTSSSQTPVVI